MKGRHPQRRDPRRIPQRGEEGFTLVEVVVAGMVILIVMLSVGVVLISSLGGVAYARQGQDADHLLDQTLEQVRALPFATLQTGLYSGDTTNDTAINGGLFQGRTVLMSSTRPPAPLYPHQTTVAQSSTSVGTYTISVYPTAYNGPGPAGVVEVTVVVSWTAAAKRGLPSSVTGQTLVYSPSAGCLAPADHPFAAPCQPFLYANATTGTSAFTVTPDTTVSTGLSAVLKTGQLLAPSASVDLQSEQISSVSSSATPPGILIDPGTGPVQIGGTAVNSYADNDAGTTTVTYSSNTGPTTVNASQSVSAPNGTGLTLAGTGSVGGSSAIAASAAGASQVCTDLSGTSVTTGLACGRAQSGTASATPLSATASIPVGGPTANITLASLSDSVNVFAGRAATTGSTFCTTTTGDGCVRAATARSVLSLGLGGLPAGVSPANWQGSFLQVNTTDTSSAESGVTPASPAASSGASVTYYNPSTSSYAPLNPASLPAPLTETGTINGQSVIVSMTLQDAVVGAATTSSTACATNCEQATATSPLLADLHYTVTVNGVEVLGVVLHADLGSSTAKTTYQAAPVAG